MLEEAVACAKAADVVIACVGEAKEHTGESSTRTDIGLPGSQLDLLKALHATGKPLVLVTMSGRPLALEWENRNADAILHCWFAGTEAGNAIADLLFGKANPCGKLAMSFPRSAGQCPIFYAEAPTGRPLDKIGIDVAGDDEVDSDGRHVFRKFTTACRLEGPHTPLYPFGYGLSYSTFEYASLTLDKSVLDGEGDALQGGRHRAQQRARRRRGNRATVHRRSGCQPVAPGAGAQAVSEGVAGAGRGTPRAALRSRPMI